MILAIDIANTDITLGCMEENTPVFVEQFSTQPGRTELEYAVIFSTLLQMYNLNKSNITGAIIASEVPPLTETLKNAIYRFLNVTPLIVGPGVKNGLNIRMDNPAQVGAGVIIDAVAGISEYGAPLIIVDMGTATTVSVIDASRTFLGGMIIPGVLTSLNALVDETSQLPKIGLDSPKSLIGKNTIDSMKSGLVYGQAACLDGLIDRISSELCSAPAIVATGNVASKIIPYCNHSIEYDKELPLKGLALIYSKNTD